MSVRNESGTITLGGDQTIHRLGFGAMRLTGDGILGPPPDESAAVALIETALELGIDLIDTADSYGPGTSERLLGRSGAPEDALVASKAGLLRNSDGDWIPHGDPEYLLNQVLCSRDRLGVDTIDLYQFHRPDPDVPFVESIEAFASMQQRGHVRHVGLSNVSREQLATARDRMEIVSVQNRYHLGDRRHEPVLGACEAAGIAFIPWGPLTPLRNRPPEQLLTVADELDATPAQTALAWLLEHSPVICPIPGTASREHLRENVKASQLSLSADQRDRLDAIDPV